MKSNIILLVYSSILILCSCGAGVGDSADDLGAGYTYSVDGNRRWIYPDNVFGESIFPNVIAYNFDEDFIIAEQKPAIDDFTILLAENLTAKYQITMLGDTASNSDLNKKQFMNSNLWRDSILRMKFLRFISIDNHNNILQINSIVDSIISVDPYYKLIFSRNLNYWIIQKRNKQLFGPFNKDEYLIKRRFLNLPNELNFKNE